ncbi:MAG: DUF4230 domain-containing protein [Prevotella sp.]|nr:DUF4230 domain-containing protein [Prevotella sp.]
MKRLRYYAVILMTAGAMAMTGCHSGDGRQADETQSQAVDTLPMLIMQVQKCARLYTTEVKVHKIVTHDDVVRLRGSVLKQDFNVKVPLGDRKIAIPMDATLKAYIDFSQFSEKNVERSGEKITIVLPDPKVALTSSKIDQKSVREFVALSRAHFSDAEMSAYEQQGREAIIGSIPSLGIIETAKANAARVLVPMLVEAGYREEDITIAFRKEFTLNDIRKLIEN